MVPAMVARWKVVIVDAGHLMTLSMDWIVDDIVDSRVWNLISRLK
jgi:hypothetical protein